MTTEEKARAYDEALEKAREIKEKIIYSHLSTESCKAVSEYIDTIIPELAESEEEKIRKALIEVFKKKLERGFEWVEYGIPNRSVLDWLEKQKDASKAIEAVDRIDKYIDEHLANAHDMKDSNPDKKYYRGWDDALGEMARILQDVYSGEKQKESLRDFIDNFPYSVEKEQKPIEPSDYELQRHQDELYNFKVFAAKQAKEYHISFVHDFEWHNFCAELLSYFNEKQKQDWNEEDKQNLSVCLTYIKDTQLRDWLIEAFHRSSKWSAEDKSFYDSIMCEVIKEGMHLTPEQAKWFKSLPERFNLQPKQELSEEETKDLVHILKVLDDCYVYGQHDLSKTDYDNLTSTIKSLKPSWKPSEHQMSILKAVKDYVGKGSGYWGEGLGSLIDDLEKLI